MKLEDVLETAAKARPGYALASFKEAALPIYVLTARVLTLDAKRLSPIEEGCLRAVEGGLVSPQDISSFLGLSAQVLTSALAALNTRECINYTRGPGDSAAKITLTDKGRSALSEALTLVPQERLVKLVFDPYAKRVLSLPVNSLWKPRDIRERGLMEVPLCSAKRPEVEDVPLTEVDKALANHRARDEPAGELIALRRIERREMHFLPCVLLFYRSMEGEDVRVAFYFEDGFSLDHEKAFRELGGPEVVGANHALSPVVPDVSDKDGLAAALKELGLADKSVDHKQSRQDTATTAAPAARAMTQKLVRCHEHPRLLNRALTSSKARLLIVSPWITAQVVDDAFTTALEGLLKDGVQVYLGYGLADEDGAKANDRARQKAPIAPLAQQRLEALQRRYKNFSFRFVGNTHRKHLVSDSTFAVVTSFNWLSFRGDPKMKARDELGYLVTESQQVEHLFTDGLDLLNKGYDHPRPAA